MGRHRRGGSGGPAIPLPFPAPAGGSPPPALALASSDHDRRVPLQRSPLVAGLRFPVDRPGTGLAVRCHRFHFHFGQRGLRGRLVGVDVRNGAVGHPGKVLWHAEHMMFGFWTLVVVLIAGRLVDHYHNSLTIFATIFAAGAVARLLGLYFLLRMSLPPSATEVRPQRSPLDTFTAVFGDRNFFRLLLFTGLFG